MWFAKERARRKRNAYIENTGEKTKGVYIPEASIYDDQSEYISPREGILAKRTVTVFGYSSPNLEPVLEKFRKIGSIKEIGHGRNWTDIRYEREKSMFQALQENGAIVNGEMVGVAQRGRKNMNVGRVEKSDLLIEKKEGAFVRLFVYLFGG